MAGDGGLGVTSPGSLRTAETEPKREGERERERERGSKKRGRERAKGMGVAGRASDLPFAAREMLNADDDMIDMIRHGEKIMIIPCGNCCFFISIIQNLCC